MRSVFHATSAAAIIAASAVPAQAMALTADAESNAPMLDEIVVTAQKRAESLQDVPLSINAISSSELQSRGIAGVQDLLAGGIPSLRVVPVSGRTSAFVITMRGINPGGSTDISRDSPVGMYVDGIYLGRVHGLGAELLDLERIEVLRGPQGTLFGRNSMAGAISMISRRPTGEFSLDQMLGVSNFDGFHAATHVNLPSVAGINIKLDGVYKERDGLVDNPHPGAWDWGQYKRWGIRASALWEPTDDISILYAYDRSKDRTTPYYTHIKGLAAGSPPLAPMFGFDTGRVDVARAGVPLKPSVGKVQGHSLTAEWRISDGITVKSITGYRKISQSQDDNFSGAFFAYNPNGPFGRRSLAIMNQDQFSQELQLIGDAGSLKYILGAFYFEEDAEEGAASIPSNQFNADGTDYTVLPEPDLVHQPWLWRDRAAVNHAETRALFGQATYTPAFLDERLHLTGGLRYTEDRKNGRLTYVRRVEPSPPLEYNARWKRTDYLAALAYDWTDDINGYVRWSTGYRAGGAHARSPTYAKFDPESVSNWEVGLKSEFWSRRARFNVTAFQMKYKNIQQEFPYVSGSASEVVNALETVRIRGIEADLTLAPARGLTMTASYAYLDTEPMTLFNPLTEQIATIPVIMAPKHAGSGAVDYRFDAFGVPMQIHVDGIWSSKNYNNIIDTTEESSYFLANARFTIEDVVRMGGGSLSLSLWGKNIFGKRYDTYDGPFVGPTMTGAVISIYNEPSTYGVEARIRF